MNRPHTLHDKNTHTDTCAYKHPPTLPHTYTHTHTHTNRNTQMHTEGKTLVRLRKISTNFDGLTPGSWFFPNRNFSKTRGEG